MPNNKSSKEESASWDDVKRATQSFAKGVLESTRSTLHGRYETGRERVAETAEEWGREAQRVLKKAEVTIREKPFSFVMGALAAGVLLGLMIRRK